MKLAIFDFCDTLVNFQSADAFVRFSLKKSKIPSSFLILTADKFFSFFKFYSVLRKLNISSSFQKIFLLNGMKGMSNTDIINFAIQFDQEVVQKKLNKEIYNLLLKHIKNNDEIIINSGGYDVYLEIFARNLGIKKLYATQFNFINGKFTGKMLGKDCLGTEKINRMAIDGVDFRAFSEIFVYSDSVTDMPIFNIATKRFAILKDNVKSDWCKGDLFQIIKV